METILNSDQRVHCQDRRRKNPFREHRPIGRFGKYIGQLARCLRVDT